MRIQLTPYVSKENHMKYQITLQKLCKLYKLFSYSVIIKADLFSKILIFSSLKSRPPLNWLSFLRFAISVCSRANSCICRELRLLVLACICTCLNQTCLTFDINVGAVLGDAVSGAQADGVKTLVLFVHALQAEGGGAQGRVDV